MDIPSHHPSTTHNTRTSLPSDPFSFPNTAYSSSVPAENYLHSRFPQRDDDDDDRPIRVMDGLSHRRSNSYGYQLEKPSSTTSPSSSRRGSQPASASSASSPSTNCRGYVDPYGEDHLQGSSRSLGSVREEGSDFKGSRKSSLSSSRRSSACSFDSDSSPGSRTDASSRSGDRQRSRKRSNDVLGRGYSSGEFQRSSPRGSKGDSKSKEGSTSLGSRLYRVLSDVGLNTSPKTGQRSAASADKKGKTPRRSSGGNGNSSGQISSGGSGGDSSQPRSQFQQGLQDTHSSSDGGGSGRHKLHSPTVICKDDDPTYIHNSINLYLDMEVFDSTKDESFRMAFKSPVVKYGEVGELPVLVVVSNIHAYIFKIVAPEK